MPRLRTLYIGTKTVGDVTEDQHILVIDGLSPDHMKDLQGFERKALPPLLAFAYEVDIPEADDTGDQVDITTHADAAQGRRVALDVEGPTNTTSHAAWVEKNYEARTHRDAAP